MANLRDLSWCYTPWAGFLGALGGWAVKACRRYLLPLSGGLLAWGYGVSPARCCAYTVTTILTFCLGYSPDRFGLWMVAACGFLYGLTPWCLGFRWAWVWWPFAHSAAFAGLTYASLAWSLPWKIVEMAVFGLSGFWVSWVLHRESR